MKTVVVGPEDSVEFFRASGGLSVAVERALLKVFPRIPAVRAAMVGDVRGVKGSRKKELFLGLDLDRVGVAATEKILLAVEERLLRILPGDQRLNVVLLNEKFLKPESVSGIDYFYVRAGGTKDVDEEKEETALETGEKPGCLGRLFGLFGK